MSALSEEEVLRLLMPRKPKRIIADYVCGPHTSTPVPSAAVYRRLLSLIGRLRAATPDQIAVLSPDTPERVEEMVDRLAAKGRAEVVDTRSTVRCLRPSSQVGGLPRAVRVTRLGWEVVQREHHSYNGEMLPMPLQPRSDAPVHHLLVVAAAIQVLRARHVGLVTLAGDEQLRSESRSGRRLRKGQRDELLPDGRLVYRASNGKEASVHLEILVSKYSDVDIRAKYRLLPPDTLFFVPTDRLRQRVQRLGCPAPALLT